MDDEMIKRCRAALKSKIVSVALRDSDYDEAVTSIIKAMREPTKRMIKRGYAVRPTEECWRKMIDAIINE